MKPRASPETRRHWACQSNSNVVKYYYVVCTLCTGTHTYTHTEPAREPESYARREGEYVRERENEGEREREPVPKFKQIFLTQSGRARYSIDSGRSARAATLCRCAYMR